MSKKPVRTKSQTLSLRTSPATRFALERSSVYYRQSMTDVIERSVSLMLQAEEFDLPIWIKPLDQEKTITLNRVIGLVWNENEAIRILRTAIIAPALLTSDEAHIAMAFLGMLPFKVGNGVEGDFFGEDDPFEGVDRSPQYYKDWPRINLKKCEQKLEAVRETSTISTFDLGLAFRGKLGDIRKTKFVPYLS